MSGARAILSRLPKLGWLRVMERSHSSKRHGPAGARLLTSALSAIRDVMFSFDLYGYTPSLIVSEYKTLISLITSTLVITAFLTAVAYTTYIWVMATLNQTEAEQVHDEAIVMLPPRLVTGIEMLPLPQFGVLLLLGNGTFINWANSTSAFRLTFQQSVICNSDAANKKQDPVPSQPCSFDDTSNIANPTVTRCAAWDAATIALNNLSNTATNVCNVDPDSSGSYSVPRIMGTFYNTEYSYITATVSINTSLMGSATFVNMVSKGSMQVFLAYNYTSPGNLAQGVIQPDLNQSWSRRLNLFPNMTVKAEVLIRSRVAAVHSYWWDVPSLQSNILDYSPWTVETYVSIPGNAVPGFTDIGKVFLHFDDKDTLMDLVPQNDALAIVSGWGGFLSILLAVGAPAVMINQMIFHQKVKKLISDDKITFDEEVREMRSEAVSKSYAAMGGKAVMNKPSIRSRRGSVLGSLLPARLHRISPSPSKPSSQSGAFPPAVRSSGAIRSSPQKPSSTHDLPDGSVSGTKLYSADSVSAQAAGSQPGRPPRPPLKLPSNQVFPTTSLGLQSAHVLGGSDDGSLGDGDLDGAGDRGIASALAPTACIDNQELQHMAAILTPGEQQDAGPQPVSEARELFAADLPDVSTKNSGHQCQQLSSQHPADHARRRSVVVSEHAEGRADTSVHRRMPSVAKSLDCDCGVHPTASVLFERLSQFSVEGDPEQVANQQVASMAVKYDGDCFADDDEEENYEDVVRHATSECNALFHLRQVVKLVQLNSPVLTLWSDHLTQSKEPVVKRKRTQPDGDMLGMAANDVHPPEVPTEPQAGYVAEPEGRGISPTRTVAALEQQRCQSNQGAEGPAHQDGYPEGGLTAHLSQLQKEKEHDGHGPSAEP